MKTLKTIYAFIISLFTFSVNEVTGANMNDILDELNSSFDKMNFDGSFDSRSEQNNFNLRVAKALKGNQLGAIMTSRPPMATGDSSAVAQGLIASSKGDLNITVERKSINIDAKLPYVLFGSNDFSAGYLSTLAGYLPAGVAVAVSTSAGKVIFTYTQGANVDVIEVAFTGNSNYVSFLQSMNQTYFKTRYVLYSISNVTFLDQFFEVVSFGVLTSLGMKNANQLSPNSRKLPSDFQDDRVNLIFPEQSVNPDFSFVQNFSKHVMVINWDVFMSDKVSLNAKL